MQIKILKLGGTEIFCNDSDDLRDIQRIVNKEFNDNLNEIKFFLKEITE